MSCIFHGSVKVIRNDKMSLNTKRIFATKAKLLLSHAFQKSDQRGTEISSKG